jgi:hypothetical protein
VPPRPLFPGAGSLIGERLREELVEVVGSIPVDDGGGASMLKTLMLADVIIELNAKRVVEIGVYRGRLLLPLAVVMERRELGEVVGIDPYSANAAEQHDDHHVGVDLRVWPGSVDWDSLHGDVVDAIGRLGLRRSCRLLRMTSHDAAQLFEPASIDLLHIDGNHDREAVLDDARLYLPLVTPGGYVVLDDAGWSSVRPVLDHLIEQHELVFQLLDGHGLTTDGIGGNDFAVFRVREGARAIEAAVS